MITPVKALSVPFTSDGTSTVLMVDLSTIPAELDLRGQSPVGIQTPTVTYAGGSIAAQATIDGSMITVTLASAPPKLDGNAVLILYTLSLLVQFNG